MVKKCLGFRSLLAGVLLILVVLSCTKTTIKYNRFGDRGIWKAVLIDDYTGTVFSLPTLRVSNCKPEQNEYCEGTWDHAGGTSTAFKWHFGFSGSFFEMHPVAAEPTEINQAWQQCYNLSGKYDVVRLNSRKFQIESEETTGYPGKLITIHFE
jgi:hypothetical protein